MARAVGVPEACPLSMVVLIVLPLTTTAATPPGEGLVEDKSTTRTTTTNQHSYAYQIHRRNEPHCYEDYKCDFLVRANGSLYRFNLNGLCVDEDYETSSIENSQGRITFNICGMASSHCLPGKQVVGLILKFLNLYEPHYCAHRSS
eukprot:gb/GECG01007013.1/.p1 GENE.gb/GECG01007013.1/~~gb/GECG01007013.1/.p1  ORF type:complete len:146 (+),score=4.64 gb/GECG01007013.1/:1-438(+)